MNEWVWVCGSGRRVGGGWMILLLIACVFIVGQACSPLCTLACPYTSLLWIAVRSWFCIVWIRACTNSVDHFGILANLSKQIRVIPLWKHNCQTKTSWTTLQFNTASICSFNWTSVKPCLSCICLLELVQFLCAGKFWWKAMAVQRFVICDQLGTHLNKNQNAWKQTIHSKHFQQQTYPLKSYFFENETVSQMKT